MTKEYNGLANIGFKPTVDGTELTLEVHLLDFNKDIYGSDIQIDFMHRIRGERVNLKIWMSFLIKSMKMQKKQMNFCNESVIIKSCPIKKMKSVLKVRGE